MSESQQYLTVTALTQYLKRKFEVDPYLGKVYLTGKFLIIVPGLIRINISV
ncbi:hypothetical protein TUA1478L_32290 [Lactiplantibacillus plantarum]